jgi:hypothetical protein
VERNFSSLPRPMSLLGPQRDSERRTICPKSGVKRKCRVRVGYNVMTPTPHWLVIHRRRNLQSECEPVRRRQGFRGLNTANANPKFGTPGRCGGMQIMGKQVVYRSRLGFHGTDVVVYEYISDWGERAVATVIIAVR